MLSLWKNVQVSVQMESICKEGEWEAGGLLLPAPHSTRASKLAPPAEGLLLSVGCGTDAAILANLFQLTGWFAFFPSYRKEGQCGTAFPARVCMNSSMLKPEDQCLFWAQLWLCTFQNTSQHVAVHFRLLFSRKHLQVKRMLGLFYMTGVTVHNGSWL